MSLKIICIEEHLTDVGLFAATRSESVRLTPYMAGLGGRFKDDPDAVRSGLPRSEIPLRAMNIAAAPIEDRFADMELHRIDLQVLSYPHPAQFAPIEVASELTRAANDRLAKSVARYPQRLAGFSTLPWADPEAAVLEVERSASQLGLTATMLIGCPGEDVFLDDPRFEPILAKLEELQVPIYLHPGPPMLKVQESYFAGFDQEVTARFSAFGWGMHQEAGVQVLRLILSGTLDRHPGLRLISGHWGEMVPFFLHRLDETMPPGATGLTRSVSQTYRDQVFVTPSGMLGMPHFRFVYDVIGAERIIFSTDYPYLTLTGARAWLESLPISDAERNAIAYGNAERLLHLPN